MRVVKSRRECISGPVSCPYGMRDWVDFLARTGCGVSCIPNPRPHGGRRAVYSYTLRGTGFLFRFTTHPEMQPPSTLRHGPGLKYPAPPARLYGPPRTAPQIVAPTVPQMFVEFLQRLFADGSFVLFEGAEGSTADAGVVLPAANNDSLFLYETLGKVLLKCLIDRRPVHVPMAPIVFSYLLSGHCAEALPLSLLHP